MESAVDLESEAELNDDKASDVEREAFAMLEANNQAWVLKGNQAKSLRETAIAQRQRAVLLRQQRSSQLLHQQDAIIHDVGDLVDELDARMTKRALQTVTTVCTIGQELLRNSETNQHHITSFLTGGTETVAEMFVNSSEGRVLKEQWEQAQCDKDIHECLNNMVLALLSLLHGHEHGTSRPTYNDTCVKGLRGRSMAIDCTICEGSRSMKAHVGTFMEAKLSLMAKHEAMVGQSWDRVQALQDEQPGRNTWRTALIGKEAFQLWDFKTNRSGRCLQSVSTALLSFSVETDSPGFQLFVRWLATDLKALGYTPPLLPEVLAPSSMVIDSVVAGNDAWHADELSEGRSGVLVYMVKMEDDEAAVVKIPSTYYRYEREETNLKLVQKLVQEQPGLRGRTTVLAGTAKLQLGQKERDALIIKPYAQAIPLDTSFQQLVLYMQQFVGIVGSLFSAGYLHRDLSYSNLLISGDHAIISDWETMIPIKEQQAAGTGVLRTGTPLFAAVSTLMGQPHSLSSELETLFNVMLYILSGGVLHWQGRDKEHHHLPSVRFGAMHPLRFEQIMLKRVDRACWPALQRLRVVFFPKGGYRTDVSCQDFLDAL